MRRHEERGKGRMWKGKKKKSGKMEERGEIGAGRRADAIPPDAMAQICSVTHASSLWTDGFYGACAHTDIHTNTHW